ncbi:MAG: CCA tRNA nucleotidyltransferase [Planctomycetota bacterium]|nr:MAG: CCA tRNA nucleotidyltransferase [Planctomycetota bacterium]
MLLSPTHDGNRMMSRSETARRVALEVVQRLRDHGYQALWAGGCVRDILLGIEPLDYDVATSAVPQQVVAVFGKRHTRLVGAAFGVVLYVDPDTRIQVEIATFRTDASYSDGRHPDAVTFSTPEEDALRRDFTINGMFYDPLEGRVIDYVGGRKDLEAGVIRAIGDPEARIAEDKLRMLRAVRFAARFGFEIEPRTFDAIRRHAGEIEVVAPERICMEVQRTLECQRASEAVRLWHRTGLLPHLFPEIAEDDLVDAAARLLEHLSCADWIVKLAALMVPWGDSQKQVDWQEVARRIQRRLRLSNDQRKVFEYCLSAQPVLARAPELRWSQVQPVVVHEACCQALELLEARCRAGQAPSACRDAIAWVQQRLKLPPEQLNPPPLITGDDLKAAGIPPGRHYSRILARVREMQLDGELVDAATALQHARRIWQEIASTSGGPRR